MLFITNSKSIKLHILIKYPKLDKREPNMFNKLQISNYKFQTSSKLQLPNDPNQFVCNFGFGHWNLFVIWDLLFGAYQIFGKIPLINILPKMVKIFFIRDYCSFSSMKFSTKSV
ncbi:MAG: hypothetical protein SCARUB_01021 [Candidatus Scalindua rubra]|uniref:Uncharacterized protein n=1 Tax=Candidatus Scalindua rubra TaxID=1872076 RepID=A0A1E3XE49_9BACT|nr:MAG: hypothetical protein SCARUB_01021 [Candidatus Scalindua rubra]